MAALGGPSGQPIDNVQYKMPFKAVPANIHVICQKKFATSVFEPKKYAKRRQIRNTHKWFETGLKQ